MQRQWTMQNIGLAALHLLLIGAAAGAQTQSAPVSLDHVVAAVNDRPILASDIADQVQLSILEPTEGVLTPQRALEELISQALIQQQIRQKEALAVEAQPAEIDARLKEIRSTLPACVHAACATADGWKSFLDAHQLTERRVRSYLKFRIEILNFIEQRFRAGISLDDEEIQNYYREHLLPQYRTGETPPALESVSKRIQEILLEQRVNDLFDVWLNNLRQEGDVELLDPAYGAANSAKAPREASQ